MNLSTGSTEHPDADAARRSAGDARREHLNRTLLRVADGDRQAYAEFYRLTASYLFGIIVRILPDRGEAEDVLQEVYISAWRRADSFDPARGNAITWLVTLGRNRAIDRLRQRKEATLDDDLPEQIDEAPTPAAAAEASQERERLERCLQALEPRHGHAVREAFFSGATYQELADRLRVPLGTMKSWIRRSLMQLKACLES